VRSAVVALRTTIGQSALVDDRFANPFAKVKHVHPDNPDDRQFIVRYARHHEPDPLDAEHLALGIAESIRDGEMTLTIEDDVVIMRTANGEPVTVALSELR
jgi:hypothetical protein